MVKINVTGTEITILSIEERDYISLEIQQAGVTIYEK